jgi:hypothetical protein
MLEALAQGKASRRVRRAAFFVGIAAVLTWGGVATAGADISVESLQVGLVAGPSQVDRSTLDLDQGVIGDTVRVSALVRNDGTAAVGEFDVDIFFTETISGEHGRLGTQVVSGLEPGEAKRPVITFDTTAFSPGIYAFSAEADPRDSLGDANPCDNVAPRGACAGAAMEDSGKYSITLLREGRHISSLTVSGTYPLCRMGKLDPKLTVSVHNVGTETLSDSDLAVYGYYRQGFSPPANTFEPLVTDASGNPAQLSKIVNLGKPGLEGSILITLNYDVFARLFAPSSAARDAGEVLGRANPVQIRITVQPADGSGTAQDLFLPAQFELSQFYSTTDLWTFPQRSACCSGDCAAVTSADVVPAVAGGFVFHVVRSAGEDKLYVLQVGTGVEKATWSAPSGKTLVSSVASYDGTDTYRVYLSASDGRIYALEGTNTEEGFSLVDRWQSSSASADAVVKGDTHVVLSADTTKLIIGSELGAFVLDAATGQIQRRMTSHVPVTSAPAYSDATGDLWIASDQKVYRVPATGSECFYDVKERVTTDLVPNARGTALFFGTETGSVYAVNPTTCLKLDDDRPLRSVAGIAVVSRDDDAVVFLTSEIGEVAREEYSHGTGRGFRSNPPIAARSLQPDSIVGAPAILPNSNVDDALVVFTVGQKREGRTTRPILLAWEAELQKYETVTVWGLSVPFLFKPEEEGKAPDTLLRPVVDAETLTLLVASSDGILYAFDLSSYAK